MSHSSLQKVIQVYRWLFIAAFIFYTGLYFGIHLFQGRINPLLFHFIVLRVMGIIGLIAFIVLTLVNYVQSRQYPIAMLLAASSLLLGYYVFDLLSLYSLNHGSNYDNALLFISISGILFTIAPLPFLIFLISFTRDHIRNHQLFLIILGIGMYIDRVVTSAYFGMQEIIIGDDILLYLTQDYSGTLYISVITALTNVYVAIFAMVEMLRENNVLPSRRFSHLSMRIFVMAAIFLAFIYTTFMFFVGDFLDTSSYFGYFWKTIAAPLSPLIAILVISIPYFGGRIPGFLTIQSLRHLLIIRKDGLPLFEFNFTNNNNNPSKQALFSGSIAAINMIMSETMDVHDVQAIKFDNAFLMTTIHEGNAFVLLAEKETMPIQQGLERFRDLFSKRFIVDQGSVVRKYEYTELENIINMSFGFL